MAILSVRKYGDPILRRRAARVEAVTPEIRKTIADMIDTMYDEVGLGLAAPQIGVPLRLMVVADDEGREARALVNPIITEQGGEVVAEEGCLSIPGVFAPVKRAEWVRLEAEDPEGRAVALTARGLRARVFQHELDHLDGVLFTDRLTSLDTLRRVEELVGDEKEEAVAAASG